MKATHYPITLLLALAAVALAAASARALPQKHPEELPRGNPVCSRCHDSGSGPVVFQRFDHTPYFLENHRHEAYQAEEVCTMCHRQSFCTDCHGTRVELKPSLKNQSDTYRRAPHRGDYLARHRIDGRIDPTSCLRCHGNPKTAERCIRCHG